MKRWRTSLLLLAGVAAAGVAIPAAGQRDKGKTPESLLPPGFGEQPPPPAPKQAPPPPPPPDPAPPRPAPPAAPPRRSGRAVRQLPLGGERRSAAARARSRAG